MMPPAFYIPVERLMNIRDLEYIVALADKKRFGLAAKACNVSQPALSLQIKKFEESIGIKLFDRGSHGAIPTEEAAFIISNARLILEKVCQIEQHAHKIAKGERPKLITLGVIPTIAPYYLPVFFENLSGFREQGTVHWHILEDKTESVLEKLDNGAIDAAVMVVPETGIDHAHIKLFDEALYFAAREDHALAKKEFVTSREIRDEDWLLLDEGHCLNVPMLEVCNQSKGRPERNRFRATSLETLRHMVAHGSGVTLIPEMARRRGDGVAYVPIKSSHPYKREVSLVWRENALYSQSLQEMARYLAAQAGHMTELKAA